MHKPIGSIFTLVGGGTPSTKDERYWGKGIPWFSSADIDRFGAIKYRKTVTELGVENSTTNIVEQGIVVVVTRVGLGKVALLPCDMCFSQDIQALIPKNTGEVFGPFVFYQLQYIMQSLRYKGQGTTISGITKKQLADVNFYLPVHSEQERIVSKIEELFSKLDASVAELQTAKEKLKVYRQAVLKEAFTGFTQMGLVEMSEIVEDIRIGPFGTMLHKADYVSGGVPVINPQHIKKLSIIPSEKVTVSQEKYVELAPYQLRENDIIMGRRGEMGRAAAITKVEAGWICGTGSILFRLKPEYDAAFYSQILSSPDTVHYLEDHATGTTMKNLNESIVKHIPVPKVTRQMQEEIITKLEEESSICESIEKTIDTSLQQAEALRQSILKQAFGGRL